METVQHHTEFTFGLAFNSHHPGQVSVHEHVQNTEDTPTTHIGTCICTHTVTYTHACTYMHTHTHIHKSTHTHIYVLDIRGYSPVCIVSAQDPRPAQWCVTMTKGHKVSYWFCKQQFMKPLSNF